MAVDPSIIFQLKPNQAPDYFGAYGNALTLKNLIGQGRMQDMQLAQAQREQDKQMRLADLVRSSGGDFGRFQQGYMEIDPLGGWELGMKQRKADAEIAKFGAEGRKLALESADKFKPLYLQAAQFVKSRGYAPESVQEAKRFLLGSGVPQDLVAGIPDNPGQQFIDSYIASNMTFSDQLARDKEEFERDNPGELGKLLAARDRFRTQMADASQSGVDETTKAQATSDTTAIAPTVAVRNVPTPFDPVIARLQQGDENEAFLRGPDGKIIPNTQAQEFQTSKARAGATKIDVGVNAYEKELNKQDAQEVSKARAGAETADRTAAEVRTIVDVLRGYKGGQWNVWGAKLGELLPGTEFAKAASANQIAEAIRNRLGPTMRVAGTGSQSDFETRALMSSIPSLLQYEEGRELLARVFERAADRAAAAADIKDNMIRGGNYSTNAYRQAMRSQFGEGGLLSKEELATVNRIRQSPPPEPGATAPIPKADFNLNSMPDPKANAGREIEATDGTRYRSDGTKWIRQPKGGASGRF